MKLSIVLFLILSLALLKNVFAAEFNANILPNLTEADSKQLFNLSVTNLDSQNITQVNLTFPSNFSFILDSQGSSFTNATFSNTSDTLSWKNLSIANNTTEYFWFNMSVPKNPGNFTFSIAIFDSAENVGNMNISITIIDPAPKWYNASATPSSPAIYARDKVYYFSINWTDNAEVKTVVFEWNGEKNYTYPQNMSRNGTNASAIYTVNLTNLAANQYTYKWYAWDDKNNLNSVNFSYKVDKAPTILTLTASPSWTVFNGTRTVVFCSANNAEVEVKLYRNNTLVSSPDNSTLAVGNYLYVCNNTATQNYTANSTSNTLKVLQVAIDFAISASNLILVEQNSSNSTIVEVKNIGNIAQDINFTIEGINSTWYTINVTNASFSPNKTVSFLINFSLGKEKIGNYEGKFKVYNPNKTMTFNFVLRVMPNFESKNEISSMIENFKIALINLENEINKYAEENVTIAKEKLKQMKENVTSAENYVKQGDYFSAYILFDKIKGLANEIESELENIKKVVEWRERRKTYIIISVIGILVIVSILAYLFWPVKEKAAYKPIEKEKLWNKIKEKFKKLRKKEYKYKP